MKEVANKPDDGPKWRDASGGKYNIPTGDGEVQSVPGVTTILGTLPKQDAFVGAAIKKVWTFMAANPGASKDEARNAWYGDTAARDLGSFMHGWFEAYLNGANLSWSDLPSEAAQGHGLAFATWCEKEQPEPIQTEATVANLTHGYAGTGDLWATIDGKAVLLDYKTGYVDPFSVALQLTAYEHGEFIITPEGERLPPIPVERLAVLGTKADGTYTFQYLESDMASFLAILHTYNFLRVRSHCLPACPVCGGEE